MREFLVTEKLIVGLSEAGFKWKHILRGVACAMNKRNMNNEGQQSMIVNKAAAEVLEAAEKLPEDI